MLHCFIISPLWRCPIHTSENTWQVNESSRANDEPSVDHRLSQAITSTTLPADASRENSHRKISELEKSNFTCRAFKKRQVNSDNRALNNEWTDSYVHSSQGHCKTSMSRIQDCSDYWKWQCEAPLLDKTQSIFWANIAAQIQTEGHKVKYFIYHWIIMHIFSNWTSLNPTSFSESHPSLSFCVGQLTNLLYAGYSSICAHLLICSHFHI